MGAANVQENSGLFTLASAQEYLSTEPELTVTSLGGPLYSVTDGVIRTMFAVGDSGVVACDTFGTPGAARAYARAIASVAPDLPITTVIYSHDHLDHAGFAADLAPQAEIIADELCAKVIKARGAQGQQLPSRVLSGTHHDLRIEGIAVTLLNPGPSHGSGHLSVLFPEQGVMYSPDTVLANARYGFMPDYHFGNFLPSMRALLQHDWQVFVPGRYGLADREGFERGLAFIEAMMDACQQAFVNFVPIWMYEPMRDYCSAQLRDRFGDLEGFEDHVGQMAIRIVHHYLMGGWGLEDNPEPGVVLDQAVVL